jgi:hypothetical protein
MPPNSRTAQKDAAQRLARLAGPEQQDAERAVAAILQQRPQEAGDDDDQQHAGKRQIAPEHCVFVSVRSARTRCRVSGI